MIYTLPLVLDSLYRLTSISIFFFSFSTTSTSSAQSIRSQASFQLIVIQEFLTERKSTLRKPWFGHDVPVGEESLYFGSGYSSTAHPVFDSGYVESDLSINIDSLTWSPVSKVFYVATVDIFAMRGNDNPPN
jgi:hypothetical protein